MKLYIDPGTGSMLFAILIGIIGALNFALRGWIIKLRFLLSGGKRPPSTRKSTRWPSSWTTSATGT